MKDKITLHAKWVIKAPLNEVFSIMTDFEKWPEYFPKVAQSIQITGRVENNFELTATVKSFGRNFPVKMKTHKFALQIYPTERILSPRLNLKSC